jgi:hypothetical protein
MRYNRILSMKPLKKTFAGLALIAATTFGAKAQSSGNLLAFNDNAKTKTETKAPAKAMNAPMVLSGTSNDAWDASRGKRLSVLVYTGQKSEMSGEEIAKTVANAFADRRFTDKPMYITAVHEKVDDDRLPSVVIFMDGVRYSKNDVGVFTPRQVGGAIDIIAEDFVSKHGSHLVIPEGVEPTLVASLH